MFVRLTSLSFLPGTLEEAKRIFKQEIVPVVKQQRGNKSIMLLEPTDASEDFISLTIWESIIDAHEYERSGKYKDLIEKAKHTYARPPVLQSYKVD